VTSLSEYCTDVRYICCVTIENVCCRCDRSNCQETTHGEAFAKAFSSKKFASTASLLIQVSLVSLASKIGSFLQPVELPLRHLIAGTSLGASGVSLHANGRRQVQIRTLKQSCPGPDLHNQVKKKPFISFNGFSTSTSKTNVRNCVHRPRVLVWNKEESRTRSSRPSVSASSHPRLPQSLFIFRLTSLQPKRNHIQAITSLLRSQSLGSYHRHCVESPRRLNFARVPQPRFVLAHNELFGALFRLLFLHLCCNSYLALRTYTQE
jgi:hypothetical protein